MKSLWRRARTALVGQAINIGLGVASSIPIARCLGPAGKGQYAYYAWVTAVSVLLLARGWHPATATFVSGSPDSEQGVVACARRALGPAALGLLAGAAVLAGLGVTEWSLVCATAAVQIWGHPASGALLGHGRLGAYYAGMLTQGTVLFAGILGQAWLAGGLVVVDVLRISFFAASAALAVHSYLAGVGLGVPHPMTLDPDAVARARVLARNAWLANLAAFLTYRVDFFVVRWVAGTQALGIYSTATSLAELGSTGSNAIGQAALREIGASDREARGRVTRNVLRQGVPVAAGTVAVVGILAPVAIPIVYGDAFAPAAVLVLLLAPGVVALAVASVSSTWLNVSDRSHVTARIAWLAAGMALVSTLLLTPLMGTTGAALASSATYASMAIVLWRRASSEGHHRRAQRP